MKTLEDLGVIENRSVLLRADFTVPLDGERITDAGRIRAVLPTLKGLLDRHAKVVMAALLGRPKGAPDPKFSLAPVAKRLSELAGVPVRLAEDSTGPSARGLVQANPAGGIVLLENIRFDARETSKVDAERAQLAEELAELADVFVSDGFGVVHRKQASVYDVAKILPHAAGRLVEKEVSALKKVTDHPQHPLAVILGGSKVSDKIGVIDNMLKIADVILIGGGMTYTFYRALGYGIGKSLVEEDQISTARAYIDQAEKTGVKLVLPVDNVVTKEFAPESKGEVVAADAIPDQLQSLDIGPKSVAAFAADLADAQTIVWNGPVGVFEFAHFQAGTRGVAEALAEATKRGAYTLIGGGDSAAAVRQFGFKDSDFSHISTGGGASLEFLEGKILPGLAVLE
jgi:phosphoglycerate kinase